MCARRRRQRIPARAARRSRERGRASGARRGASPARPRRGPAAANSGCAPPRGGGTVSAFGMGALAGRRIVITRAPEQAADLVSHLTAAGADVIALPTVRFLEPANPAGVDATIDRLENFD